MLAGPPWLRFPLLLTLGSQISCFSPTNFTGKQSAYVDTACWDSLLHHGFDTEGHAVTKSLWALKVWVKLASGCPQVPPGCAAEVKQLGTRATPARPLCSGLPLLAAGGGGAHVPALPAVALRGRPRPPL